MTLSHIIPKNQFPHQVEINNKAFRKKHRTTSSSFWSDASVLTKDKKPLKRKREINNLNYIKVNNFCSPEDTTEGEKRQSTEWEKIFPIT